MATKKTKTCVEMTLNYTVPKKKAAIETLVGTNITRASMLKAAHANGLAISQLERALSNFMNFGYIDGRSKTKWQNAARSNSGLKAKIYGNIKHRTSVERLLKRLGSYKTKVYSSVQAGNLIHEFIFSSDSRTLRYLDEKHINSVEWYSWINELSTKGTLLGRKVIDYKLQKKMRITTAIKVIRKLFIAGRGLSYIKSCSYGKNLSKADIMMIRHIEHTLDLNL